MIPLKLRLKNFIGIRNGLGLDEVVIDLRDYGDAELIALVGPNGAGKTTILDNLTPYRIMASRASGYSPGSFSYFDQTYGDAVKEFDWSYDGITYRSTIVIKNSGKTAKQECYLGFFDDQNNLQYVTAPDGTISDGKASSYDHCVESILGSPALFYTAAFSCQGRKTLADYANADVKALMSDLLGLSEIRELGKTANDVAKGYRAKLEAVRDRLSRAEQLSTDHGNTQVTLDEAEQRAADLAEAKKVATERVDRAAQRLAEAQSEYAQQADHQRRRDTLTQQIDEAKRRLEKAIADIKQDFTRSRTEKQAALQKARTNADQLGRDITALQGRIQKNESLLARKQEVEQAAARVAELEKEIAEHEEVAAKYEQQVRDKQDAEAKLRQVESEGKSLRAEHDGLETRCKLTEEVPCQGTDLQGRCQLLADAMQAKETLPEKVSALEAKRKEREAAKAAVSALPADPQNSLDAARRVVASQRQELSQKRETAALQHAMAGAAEALEADKASLDSYSQKREEARAEADELDQAIAKLDQDMEARIKETETSHQSDINALQKELDSIPPASSGELDQAKSEHAAAQKDRDETDNALASANANVATLKERLANIEQEQAAIAGDVDRATRIENEIAQWSLLSKALGNDGIIALCIDDAGPAITTLANELLTTCYGPRFSVSIQTQRETGKGDLRESFDIQVFDAEHDDSKSIKDVSGGERVWLNEAMTRAIALYQAQSAGRRYGCLFSDESDGALDAEKKRQFVAMKRKVLELGGYEREIFISHTTELWNTADAVIDVTQLPGKAATKQEAA